MNQYDSKSESVIHVQGVDAATFLNAQLTRNVDTLGEGEDALAAWCNAKGRVQTLFRVQRDMNGYHLYLPRSMLELTLPRLRMFVLRSQVLLDTQEDEYRVAGNHPTSRIARGIPQIYPDTREQFLPQMLNLDLLGGIDFKKGCYPGQEIVARTQYLGQLKRRMYRLVSDSDSNLPSPGTELISSDGAKGMVLESASQERGGWECLAVIPIESANTQWMLASAEGAPLIPKALSYSTG